MNVIAVLAQESGEPGAALPHLAEIIVGFIAFSVVVYVIGKFGWPLFVKAHESDVARVEDGMRRGAEAEDEARAELAKQRERLGGADAEAARIRDDARADAERIKEDMATRADEEAERVRAQGRQTLDASRSRTVSELRGDVGRQSVELARRMVASSLGDDARRAESVDGFLDRLESMAGDGADASAPAGRGNGAGSDR